MTHPPDNMPSDLPGFRRTRNGFFRDAFGGVAEPSRQFQFNQAREVGLVSEKAAKVKEVVCALWSASAALDFCASQIESEPALAQELKTISAALSQRGHALADMMFPATVKAAEEAADNIKANFPPEQPATQ